MVLLYVRDERFLLLCILVDLLFAADRSVARVSFHCILEVH